MLTPRAAFLERARKRMKSARDNKRFDRYVATPHNLGGGAFTMPANGRLAISCSSSVEAGQLRLTVAGRVYRTPALSANQIWKLDVGNAKAVVTAACDVAGTIKVYVLDQWSRPRYIASL